MIRFFMALFGVLALANQVSAENWAHWRGPTGNGTAQGNPPAQFSSTQNVKWKVAIPGKSSGSPVVWEKQVFVVTSVPSEKNPATLAFQVHAYDRATGKQLWKQTAVEATPHQATHNTNTHASASPCTDGQHVYAHFGSRGLFCYTMDGQLVWKRDLGDMTTRNDFGEGSSPTLAGDLIIVPWDHEGPSALFALNKLTGETVWEVKRDEPTCWATPLVVEYQGQKQVVMNGQKLARGYDLKTGKLLWWCDGQTERPCASAVALGDTVFVGSGFRGSFMGAFKLSGQGDIEGTKSVVWTFHQDTPDVASPLLSGNRLYFYKGKSGQLTCLDAKTGQPHFSAVRVPGISSTYSSPVAAGGKVYLTDRSGTIVVIEDSDTFKVVATNSLDEGVDSTPAIVDNARFVRGAAHLFCIAN
ncbi:MAG: PQQ-like beta-propeller repeat protein [Pirellulaceae bacterium]|nr:PQQ-like beta-propeller repeat protein [Pirellulaceae bacterium]